MMTQYQFRWIVFGGRTKQGDETLSMRIQGFLDISYGNRTILIRYEDCYTPSIHYDDCRRPRWDAPAADQ